MRKYVILISTLVSVTVLVAVIQLLTDRTPPDLIVPNTPFQIQCLDEQRLMEGVKALDGSTDVTHKVIIENERALTQNKASAIVYVVSDENGNVVKKSRPLIYAEQNQNIVITEINKPELQINAYTNETFSIANYFMATNPCGKDVSNDLYYSGNINFSLPGDYIINLKLKNNEEVNESKTITVLANANGENDEPSQPQRPDQTEQEPGEEEENPVVASTPIIRFRDNPVTLPLESTFQFMSHIETIEDNIDDFSLLSRRVRITNLPNMFVEGEYIVTYLVTNTSGLTGIGELKVIVE